MFRLDRPVLFLIALWGCALAGCGRGDAPPEAAGDAVSLEQPLDDADVQTFLAVVQHGSTAMIPEFSPPDDDEQIDLNGPARELVEAFRGQFQKVFDIERQGAAWDRDPHWKPALTAQKLSGAQFAALVRNVSLAIMRVRLEARVDVARLIAQARRDVARAVQVIDGIDAVAKEEQTRESAALRSRSAIDLGRAVALLEFAEMIGRVPAASCTQVRKCSRRLKPLLPPHRDDDLLAELAQLAARREQPVEQAQYQDGADEPPPAGAEP